jgi:putative membrane protein
MRGKAWIAVVVLILLVFLAAAAAPFFVSPWGRGYGWGMGPGMMGGWSMMGMMFLGPILVLVLIGLFVAGAVWLVQSASRGGQQTTSAPVAGETPLDILKRRYAGGEVNKEQFEEMRKTLVQSS